MIINLFDWLPTIFGVVIVPYLAYTHKKVEELGKKVDVQEYKVNNIKEDIKEIKEGVNKLVDRELNKGRK